MVAKRVLFPKETPVAKRLKKIEYQVYRNRPEMKTRTILANGNVDSANIQTLRPCQIAQGSGVTNRIGDKIRIWRIECRGVHTNAIDAYIIQNKTNTLPAITDFNAVNGSYLLDNVNTTKFTEWVHYKNMYVNDDDYAPVKFSKKFKGGIVVKFAGAATTDIVDNEILIVLRSINAGGTKPYSLTTRIWFTDA